MCRSLKLLCAAPDQDRLTALKRAAVSVHWELTGGATEVDELLRQVGELRPDIVVIDPLMSAVGAERLRAAHPTVGIVTVESTEPERVREAILGMHPPGGPVRS